MTSATVVASLKTSSVAHQLSYEAEPGEVRAFQLSCLNSPIRWITSPICRKIDRNRPNPGSISQPPSPAGPVKVVNFRSLASDISTSQFDRHENAVRILHVICKRNAWFESKTSVEAARRPKGLH